MRCGLQVDKYNDVKVGDVIEVFVMEEISNKKRVSYGFQ